MDAELNSLEARFMAVLLPEVSFKDEGVDEENEAIAAIDPEPLAELEEEENVPESDQEEGPPVPEVLLSTE